MGELFHHDTVSASGLVHIIGVHSDDHLGQREAQNLQQGVQGLSQPPDGYNTVDSLIAVETWTIAAYTGVYSPQMSVFHNKEVFSTMQGSLLSMNGWKGVEMEAIISWQYTVALKKMLGTF